MKNENSQLDVSARLQIMLITYNREDFLKKTLTRILDKDSPIRTFDITVLDNHSTDGTPKVLEDFQRLHPNISYIRHNRNIGGNANIARAFELATKDYLWILCDDDEYYWSSWKEIEVAIENNEKVFCVADFNIPIEERTNKAYLVHQMTFLPSIIIHTSLITDSAIRNIYDSGVFLFPHLAPIITHLNNGGNIYIPQNALVHFGRHEIDNSFIRGYSENEIFNRARTMSMIVGFANLISNLANKKLARKCLNVIINGKHPFRMGYYRLLSDIFLHLNGHKNDMHITDLKMQASFFLRVSINVVHMLSNTFLHNLLVDSRIYHFLRRLYDRHLAASIHH